MTDEIKKDEQPKNIELTIIMSPDGQIQVKGPVTNLLICFGMLELAKVNLVEYAKKQQQIIQPNNRMMDFLRNKK